MKKIISCLLVAIGIFMLTACVVKPNNNNNQNNNNQNDYNQNDDNQNEHQHSLGDYLSDGTYHWRICSECNEEVSKEEHNAVKDSAVNSTCTKTGLTEGSHCSVCERVLVAQQATPLAEHSWDSGVVNNGIRTFTCHTCGQTKTEAVSLYKVVSGSFSETSTTVSSTAVNSLAIYEGKEFSQGNISIDITLTSTAGDNGIIFGLTNTICAESFWEGNGITYYFFFISSEGRPYLGKTTNGSWTVCGIDNTAYFELNKTYTLTVSRDKSNSQFDVINCYVDNVLYVSYKDSTANSGTGFGIRSGSVGVKYTNFTISDEVLVEESKLSDYHIANGGFFQNDNKIVSSLGNSIAEKIDGEFIYGTLEATMKINGIADNGLIFSLTSNATHTYWENNTSYYFFFVNIHGLAFLGKVDNGTWTTCQETAINGYTTNGTYELKVEKDATTIYGYVNGVCYITYADSFPLTGTGYGLRAGGPGVEYSNIKCQSSGEIVETYPNDLEVVSGKFTGATGAAKSAVANSLGLIKNINMTNGTLTASIKGVSTAKVGLIFGYSNVNGVESYYRFVSNKNSQKVDVEKVVNGAVTSLFSNYLSAGYSTGNEFGYRVVVNNGKAYCYFWNTLYYVFDLELTGTKVGIYSEGAGSQFRNYSVSSDANNTTTNTLLFGHSYFELWSNYKNDLSSLATSYGFGDYLNIGIGGSVAAHWNKFKESLVTYNASKAIYMIGINDLTGGTSPEMVVGNIKETLLFMKAAKPELTVVLLSVNHCPARSTIRTQISKTNELMRTLVAQYDWMKYAEVEFAFCDDGVNPNDYWFTDGLHPTANGYVQKIVPAIKNALDGLGQPELDNAQQAKLLQEAKDLKMCQLTDYSEWSYRANEWILAQPYYTQAVNLINACDSIDEVENLDLSSYINDLKSIKSNSDYAYQELVTFKHGTWWETGEFQNALNGSTNGVYDVTHDGHRINNNILYTDMSFKFSLNDITGDNPTVGIIFRGRQTSNLGIDGYFINVVTKENYIQIWYFRNAFSAGGDHLEQYIGGWVFPGEVEETEFRAIVEGNMVYIYTEADYQSKGKNAYGCSADLTYGGLLAPYTNGGYGILSWGSASGATGKLNISNLSGKVAKGTDQTSVFLNGINTNSNILSLNADKITSNNDVFRVSDYSFKLFNGLSTSEFELEVNPSSTADIAIAGLLFRANKNTTNDGVDGYLLNFVANASDQYVQVFYLKNCYNTNNSAVACDYIGGWVFPGQIKGTTFKVRVIGSYLFLETSNSHMVIPVCLTDANHPEYKNGSFGLLSWANNQVDLKINSLKTF